MLTPEQMMLMGLTPPQSVGGSLVAPGGAPQMPQQPGPQQPALAQRPMSLAQRLATSPGWAMAMQGAQNIGALRQGNPVGISPSQAYQRSVASQAALRQQEQEAQERARRADPFYEYEEAKRRGYAKNPDGSDMSFQDYQQSKFRQGNSTSVMRNFDQWRQLNPQATPEEQRRAFAELARASSTIDLGGGAVGRTNVLSGEPMETLVGAEEATRREAELAGARESAEQFARNREEWLSSSPQLQNSIASARDKTSVVRETVDSIMPLLDEWTTGYGAMLSSLPDTEARRLRNLLDTVRANVAFTTLQDMRANSPTGGALGQVSERELDLLMSALGSLDQAGNMDDIRAVLERIVRVNEGAVDRLQFAYDADRQRYVGEEEPEEEEDDWSGWSIE